jgi:GNAT superfamily N-acetyltransferase
MVEPHNAHIDRADSGDVPALARILEQAYQHIHGDHLDLSRLQHTPRETVIQSTLASRVHAMLVAKCEGEVIGFASFGPQPVAGLGYARRVAELGLLAVREDCRGNGVGQALFESVLARLREQPSVEKLILWVESDNSSARAFYGKMGMTPTQEREQPGNRIRTAGAPPCKETRYELSLGGDNS